jgi:hypothetical protein
VHVYTGKKHCFSGIIRRSFVTEQPFDEALRERALAVLSAMVLWMKDNKQDMGIFQEMFPVHLKGKLAEEAGTELEEYHMTIVVRKKKEIQKYAMADLLRDMGYLRKKV